MNEYSSYLNQLINENIANLHSIRSIAKHETIKNKILKNLRNESGKTQINTVADDDFTVLII